MALSHKDRLRLIGGVPLRIFLEKLRVITIIWLVLSFVIGGIYVADLLVGDSVRSATPSAPRWIGWVVMVGVLGFMVYHWRTLLVAIAQFCLQAVELGFLALVILVVGIGGTYLLGKVSGYLQAWFLISYFLALGFIDLLDIEVQKWGEPLQDQPEYWWNRWKYDRAGEHIIASHVVELPEKSLDGGPLPLAPGAFREELEGFLVIASQGIPPSLITKKQAEEFRDSIQALAEGVRDACLDALDDAEEMEDAERRVANAQLRE